jgi:Flp pilus assembly pilin Flp
MRPGQNLIEFALIALPIIVAAALLQSTLLPVLSSLFSGITQTVLSLRV